MQIGEGALNEANDILHRMNASSNNKLVFQGVNIRIVKQGPDAIINFAKVRDANGEQWIDPDKDHNGKPDAAETNDPKTITLTLNLDTKGKEGESFGSDELLKSGRNKRSF